VELSSSKDRFQSSASASPIIDDMDANTGFPHVTNKVLSILLRLSTSAPPTLPAFRDFSCQDSNDLVPLIPLRHAGLA
jgi:hypothetical protein